MCDIASLRFKFNEIFAGIQKILNENSDYDCKDVRKNVMLLQSVIQKLSTSLRLDQSIGVQPGNPLKQSTPQRTVDEMLSMSGRGWKKPLTPSKISRLDGTYVHSKPQRRETVQTPGDVYYTARQNVSTRELFYGENLRQILEN